MDLDEIIDEIREIGRDFNFHKIYFFEKIHKSLLLGFIFDNPKVSELITKTENIPITKNKLDFCVELLRNVSLKRITLSNDYFKDIKTTLQCALLIYFDFLDFSPLKGILDIYQEEIGKGNYLVLKIDYEQFKEPIIPLLAIFLVERLREIINASPYFIQDKKYIEEVVNRKFPKLSIAMQSIMKDFLKYVLEKVSIRLIDVRNQNLSPLDIFLDSIVLYYDETLEILELVDRDRFLRNIIAKYTEFIRKLILENYGSSVTLLLSKASNSKTNIEFLVNLNSYKKLEKIIDVEDLRIKIPSFDKFDEKKTKEKLGIIIKNEKIEKEKQVQLPIVFKEKFAEEIEADLYSFICENCLKHGYTDYCPECKRDKRVSFYCDNCKISNQGFICISCGQELVPTRKQKINISSEIVKKLYEIKLGPEYILSIDFINTKYIEPPEKIAAKVKNKIITAENGVAEISVKVVPIKSYEFNGKIIDIDDDEIILPNSIMEKFNNITNYLKDILNLYNELKNNTKFDILKNKKILLIRNSRNYIYYPIKIKDIIDSEFALISPRLYEKLFGKVISENEVKICHLLDFLLNASSRLINGENCSCLLITSTNENEKISKEDSNLLEKEKEDPPKVIAFNFKMNFMRSLISLIETNVSLQIRCAKCENIMSRPKIRLFCTKCGSRLTYKKVKREISEAMKEYNEYLKINTLSPIYKFNNRKIKKAFYRFFKEEEKLEKLDKFFNL